MRCGLTRLTLLRLLLLPRKLAAGCFGFFMLCEGFFKLKDDIPDYLVWGYHMAPHTYTFRVFMHNEFHPIKNLKSSQFAGQSLLRIMINAHVAERNLTHRNPVDNADGTDVLDFYGMDDVDVVSDLMVLLAGESCMCVPRFLLPLTHFTYQPTADTVAIGIQLAFGAVLQLFHTGKR